MKAAEAKVSLLSIKLAEMTKRQRDGIKQMKRKNCEVKLTQLNDTVSEVVENDLNNTASKVEEQKAEIVQQIVKVRTCECVRRRTRVS